IERRLAHFLHIANPAELGLVLSAAAIVEEVAVNDELDSVRAEMVRMPDREALGDGGALDLEPSAGSDGQLEHDLPVLEVLREELIRADLLERKDLQVG